MPTLYRGVSLSFTMLHFGKIEEAFESGSIVSHLRYGWWYGREKICRLIAVWIKRKNASLRRIELLDLEALETKKDPLALRKIHLSCSTVNCAVALSASAFNRLQSFCKHVLQACKRTRSGNLGNGDFSSFQKLHYLHFFNLNPVARIP